MSLLVIDKLNLELGSLRILKDISFQVARGSILALVGESGSGKSMTALALMQLLPPSAQLQGSIRFQDAEMIGKNEQALCKLRGAKIGMIFQEPMTALNPVMAIGDQVSETLLLHKRLTLQKAKAEAQNILERVELGANVVSPERFPHELSGGQRQRVVIAIAIAMKPSLLIADEPTTALDVTTQSQIIKLLKNLVKKDNMAMLIITHDLAVVADIADNIAVMRKGEIVENAPTHKLFSEMQHSYTKSLFTASKHAVEIQRPVNQPKKLLNVKNLTHRYKIHSSHPFALSKYFTAIDNVSFNIGDGERVGLVGESGCGKSTLTRAVLGLEPFEKGEITFDGHTIAGAKADIRRQIQVIFQDPYGSFNPRHKVVRLVCEPLFLLKNKPTNKHANQMVEQVLTDVGLTKKDKYKYIHEFSGGQRQRIAIARALIIKPKLIIFDEAVSSLDVTVRVQILNLIAKLTKEYGLSYLFISHDLSVVRSITDRCLVMRNGKIVEEGPTTQVLIKPEKPYTQSLLDATPKLPYIKKGEVSDAPS